MKDKYLLNNAIEYLAELWKNDDINEWLFHWQNIIGMDNEQMKKYNLLRGAQNEKNI